MINEINEDGDIVIPLGAAPVAVIPSIQCTQLRNGDYMFGSFDEDETNSYQALKKITENRFHESLIFYTEIDKHGTIDPRNISYERLKDIIVHRGLLILRTNLYGKLQISAACSRFNDELQLLEKICETEKNDMLSDLGKEDK